MIGAGYSLRFPFYFLADRTGRTIDEVRAMPWAEFVTWLGFHGFFELIDPAKRR